MRSRKKWILFAILLIATVVLAGQIKLNQKPKPIVYSDQQRVVAHIQLPDGWNEKDIYPDPNLTTGYVLNPEVTQETIHETICVSGYTSKIRNVTASQKRAVFEAYGLRPGEYSPGDYEVDHFCSLELGCSNLNPNGLVTENLWIQPYNPPNGEPGARQKDVVETNLHRKVCAGEMSLADAQRIITTDWYAYYLSIR